MPAKEETKSRGLLQHLRIVFRHQVLEVDVIFDSG